MSTDGLRPTFYWINGVVYAIQVILLPRFSNYTVIYNLIQLAHACNFALITQKDKVCKDFDCA
jgi:hypothetical protein